MSASNPRVLYYINQFFAGIGGEEFANHQPELREGAIGPGRLLAQVFTGAEIVGTLVCGDNYFQEQSVAASAFVRNAIETIRPDVVIAGPAFVSGRYGLACGEVARIAEELGVPAVAAMSPDNPAVSMYRTNVYIIATGDKPTSMAAGMKAIAPFAAKLAASEEIGPAVDEGYIPRGIRRPTVRENPTYLRAVDMLVAKLHKQPYRTEIPYQAIDRVEPAAPIKALKHAKIAIVTTGGLIRKGNPDKQTSSHAKRYISFDISAMQTLSSNDFEAAHAGYANKAASDNPNYIAPLSYLRDLQHRGEIADIYGTLFSLVGVGTSVETATNLGAEIADLLAAEEVDGALLVST